MRNHLSPVINLCLVLTELLLLSLTLEASKRPVKDVLKDTPPRSISTTLIRKPHPPTTVDEWGTWAYDRRQGLVQKYSHGRSLQGRSNGTNLIVNHGADGSYFGSLAIGTPAVAYNVILDTGSADLWVAESTCISRTCANITTFNPRESSTYRNLSTPFMIRYGSGQAAGILGQDVVQMAGFSVNNQVFATCDRISTGLLESPVSGLLGLAFATIASSDATPLWEAMVQAGAWDQPLMAFQLTRYINVSDAQSLEPGGSFTMGATNSSLYTGDIDYVALPGRGTYWTLPLTTLRVNGNSVSLPSGSSSYAAIDIGTTLVGGPRSEIARIYDQIPGSEAGSGNFEGYYTYPCDTSVNVEFGFGNSSRTWSVSPADIRLTELERGRCLGAFFDMIGGGSAPPWIIGDTFLKNVYSVFRYNPASVGFAQLSSIALAENGADRPVPSPTVGSVATTILATSTPTTAANASLKCFAGPRRIGALVFGWWALVMMIGVVL